MIQICQRQMTRSAEQNLKIHVAAEMAERQKSDLLIGSALSDISHEALPECKTYLRTSKC
jgi:hypothetical protein